jgi:pilus assembly protein CpaB
MNVRSLILVVVAITVAGVAALLARNLMSGQPTTTVVAAPAPGAKTKVLVAAVPMPVGRMVDIKDYRWQSWPDSNVEGYYVEGQTDPTTLVGKVVRVGISLGQPITSGNLVGPGEQGFLAAILGPGMRAVTVAVTDTSGVAGFVFPGDRVDLVLTHEIDTGEGPSRKAAETILRNVRILAIDQSTNDQDNLPKLVRTVTLEVTPQLVEYVSVMGRIGQLSLSLRPLAKEEDKLASGKTVAEKTGTAVPADSLAYGAVEDPKLPSAAHGTVTMDRDVSKALAMVRYVRGSGGGGMSGGQPAGPPPPSYVVSQPAAPAAPKPAGGSSVTIVRGGELSSVPVGGGK